MSLFFKVFFSPLVHTSKWMLVLFDHVLFISSFFLHGVWFRPHRCRFCGFNECVNLSITKDLLHSHARGGEKWHVFIKLSFAEAKANSTIISPAVWFGISALECFPFSLCGAVYILPLSWWPRPQNAGVRQKKRRQPPHGNLQRALLNKVLKHYPKLKDIHTCLKSSPPLSVFLPPFSLSF